MPPSRPHLPRFTAAWTVGPVVLALALALTPGRLRAQGHEHEDDHGEDDHAHEHAGLHFTHPLFTESVSPDTKVRLDYGRLNGDAPENEAELEGEWAFTSSFSIEAGVHYHLDEGAVGDTHILFKLAQPFQDAGVHLGYGLELGLPTGSAHEHAVPGVNGEPETGYVNPFVNAGWMAGALELVGWTRVEVPTDGSVRDAAGTGLRYNASALWHAGGRVDALVEAFGRTALSGDAAEPASLDVAPGLRVRPAPGPLVLGAGLAIPVSGEEYSTRVLVSAFWHF